MNHVGSASLLYKKKKKKKERKKENVGNGKWNEGKELK